MSTQAMYPPSYQKILRPYNQGKKEVQTEKPDYFVSLLKKHFKSREIIIQFLSRACTKYRFKKDSLFLGIKMMDLLISKNFQHIWNDSQLTAACLVLLITKYNQVYPVTIDQINLITQKYYPREAIVEIEGQILLTLDFQIPDSTVYSQLYNQLESGFQHQKGNDSDKENNSNFKKASSKPQKSRRQLDEKSLSTKTLQAIKQPDCLKYGQEFLYYAILNHFEGGQYKGLSANLVKVNYIKTILSRIFEPKQCDENNKKSIGKCLSPRSPIQNPELKSVKKQKIFCF